MSSAPSQATYEQIADLRLAIMADLDRGIWAGDIARAHNVTISLALAMFMKPERVSICKTCLGAGHFALAMCDNCRGLGYATEVGI